MALTARSIQSALVGALADSATIASQCLTYFGEVHRVNSGGTGRQGQSDAPSFGVVAWSRTAGENDVERVLEFSVLLTITDSSITETTETVTVGEGVEAEDYTITVETYSGPSKLEVLLELAAAEVLAISSEIAIGDMFYSFEPLEYFPLFVGGLDFTVTFPRLIGGYEPTIT